MAAAIEAGADSVYFGIEHLNMRARSSANFTTDDLHTIVARCKEAGVKTYLTLNTVMYPEDLPLMRTIVDNAKAAGLTAIIASDISVMQYAAEVGVEVHLSTQLNIANTEALRFYAQYADVVVLARELNMEQVAQIHRDVVEQHIVGRHGELIRIEMFCHGALCMAVSGKCYLSLQNYNSSANRGACVQVCRRGYTVTDKETGMQLDIDNQYIMSPKDLKTIHFLNKMLDAGVTVLKIEGRARGADYVKTVVSCYKEAVEAYVNGEWEPTPGPSLKGGEKGVKELRSEGVKTNVGVAEGVKELRTEGVKTIDGEKTIDEKIAEWDERLARVFNRGWWDGYYLGQRLGEWTHHYGSQATRTKVYVGKVTNYFKNIGVAEFLVEATTVQNGDEFLVTGNTTGAYEGVFTEIRKDGEIGTTDDPIPQGELFSHKTDKVLHRGDKLYKLKIDNGK